MRRRAILEGGRNRRAQCTLVPMFAEQTQKPPCTVRVPRTKRDPTGMPEIRGFYPQSNGTLKFRLRRSYVIENIGDPSRIRTCNPRSRNPLLYPVELWDRCLSALGLHSTANMKNPPSGQALSEPFSASGRPIETVDRCVCPPARHSRAAAGCLTTSRGSLGHMRLFRYLLRRPTSPSPFHARLIATRLSASQGAPS
jgi:hypothetical protein